MKISFWKISIYLFLVVLPNLVSTKTFVVETSADNEIKDDVHPNLASPKTHFYVVKTYGNNKKGPKDDLQPIIETGSDTGTDTGDDYTEFSYSDDFANNKKHTVLTHSSVGKNMDLKGGPLGLLKNFMDVGGVISDFINPYNFQSSK